jgi:hypothetical protein
MFRRSSDHMRSGEGLRWLSSKCWGILGIPFFDCLAACLTGICKFVSDVQSGIKLEVFKLACKCTRDYITCVLRALAWGELLFRSSWGFGDRALAGTSATFPCRWSSTNYSFRPASFRCTAFLVNLSSLHVSFNPGTHASLQVKPF